MHRMREGSLKSHPQDGREDPVLGRLRWFLARGVARTDPRTLIPRILEDSKKDIGESSAGGLEGSNRTLEA